MKISSQIYLTLIAVVLQVLVSEIVCDDGNHTEKYTEQNNNGSQLLSRRKRYLIFPDGSSLQLVFCVQTAALIPIGDIFLYGNTAALSWNLPTDPKLFYMLKGYDKEALRRNDYRNHIYYVDEEGKVLARVPYKRTPIVNPAFAKRSADSAETYKEKLSKKIDRMAMHERQKNREYLKKDHLDLQSTDFHRSSRVKLFEKLERLLSALGQNGRQCVLYKLCKAAQESPEQGTFLEEFLRVIFSLPKGTEFDNDDHREYDEAHNATNNCSTRYPGCEHFYMQL